MVFLMLLFASFICYPMFWLLPWWSIGISFPFSILFYVYDSLSCFHSLINPLSSSHAFFLCCVFLVAAITSFSSFMTWTSCLHSLLFSKRKKFHLCLWLEYTATWFSLSSGIEKEGTVKIWMGIIFLIFVNFFF